MTVTRKDVVDQWISKVGFKEGPNNDNPFTVAIGGPNNVPYCAGGYSWGYWHAGHPLPMHQGCRTGFLAVGYGVEYARDNGLLVPITKLGAADGVCFDWKGNRNWNDMHIEGVEYVDNDARLIHTIGFNTHPIGNSAAPEGTYRKQWSFDDHNIFALVGYGKLLDANPKPNDPDQKVPAWPGRMFTLTTPYMHGDDIKQWQTAANRRLSKKLVQDGIYGKESALACHEIEKAHNLTVESPYGVVGPQVWRATFLA